MKTRKISLILGLLSLFFIHFSFACGWFELEESIRLAFFRAGTRQSVVFQSFIYTSQRVESTLIDPQNIDEQKNCQEWQQKVAKNASFSEIKKVIYEEDNTKFEAAYKNKTLAQTYKGNRFAQALALPKNKAIAEYLIFAKSMEHKDQYPFYKEESWDKVAKSPQNTKFEAENEKIVSIIAHSKDNFLKTRYTFLLLRTCFYAQEYKWGAKLYERYLKKSKSNSIVEKWALHFYARCLDKMGKYAEANYYYSLCFDQCNEKKYIINQHFHNEPEIIRQTLKFAKNKHEKGVIRALNIINTPSPQLAELKKMEDLVPQSEYLAFLITREINKLEDWIFTPTFTEYAPSIRLYPENADWENDSRKWANYHKTATEKNYLKDIAYLRQLKAFLLEIYPKWEGEKRDILSISLAHLCFMEENAVEEGKSYIAQISANAPPSVLAQKNIELLLVCLKAEDISADSTKNKIANYLKKYENADTASNFTYKMLYSLTRIIMGEYEKKGDIATAGLFFAKSEIFKYKYENKLDSYSYGPNVGNEMGDNYSLIAYYDRRAQLKDVDNLIEILQKKRKTPFEKYITDAPLPSVNYCKELKGTIAFRENDWEMAYAIFAKLLTKFLQEQTHFFNLVDSDPFIPRIWQYTPHRKRDSLHYDLDKARFLDELLCLRKEARENPEKAAENYLLLGHALYNCSFAGNAWIMGMYERNWAGNQYGGMIDDLIYGYFPEQRDKIMKGNFTKCTFAKEYYKLALKNAQNDEQKAMANLMIQVCDYTAYRADRDKWSQKSWGNNPKDYPKYVAGQALKDFYTKYQHTQVFQQFHCPLLDEFMN